jgi:hypothetical protein
MKRILCTLHLLLLVKTTIQEYILKGSDDGV